MFNFLFVIILFVFFSLKSTSFKLILTSKNQLQRYHPSHSVLNFSDKSKSKPIGKGFGKQKPIIETDIIENKLETNQENNISTLLDSIEQQNQFIPKTSDEAILNTKMFKTKLQKQKELLQLKINEFEKEENLIATDPSVGAVPELVANRMITRIIGFFGIPVFGGLAIFVGAYFSSKQYDIVIPPVIIAYATQLPFIIGLVGISYAILSSSWDDEPGSFWGIKEFQLNLQRIKEGFDRTAKQASLREEIELETQKLKNK